MVSTSKKARGKHRLDKYYHLAKEQGYRSRAAFKLIQLNKKHGFLNDARAVLDLCAAPGGWLQVCAKHMPVASRIIGVDLDSIKPVRGVTTLVDDITTQKCRDRLRKESGGSLFDVVLHDGAPNVGGAFATEMYTQSALVLDACKLACEFLRPQGTFVTKVFRSRDYTALLYAFKQLFQRVDATKPQASRNTSAEIFVVCSGYKAPAKIDPRLLDHRSLFQDVEEQPKVMGPDALLKDIGKKQRHRTGYDADVTSVMHKTASGLTFVLAKDPMPLLAANTQLLLDGPASLALPAQGDSEEDDGGFALGAADMAELLRSHEATTAEVRELCKDLQVLGRSEFKQLLRWRLKLKKALEVANKEARKTAGEEDEEMDEGEGVKAGDADDDEDALDPEQRLLKQMDTLRSKMDADTKRSRKKRREMKKKAKVRLAQMNQSAGLGEQLTADDDQLFALRTLKNKAALAQAGEADVLDEDEMAAMLEAADTDDELVSDESGADSDSDDDGLRYEAMVEQYLDTAYQAYLQRQHARDANRVEKNRKRKRLEEDGDEGVDDKDLAALPSRRGESESDDDEEGGGLLVELDEAQAGLRKSGKAIAQQWFAQDAFKDAGLLDDEEEDAKLASTRVAGKRRQAPAAAGDSDRKGDGDGDADSASDGVASGEEGESDSEAEAGSEVDGIDFGSGDDEMDLGADGDMEEDEEEEEETGTAKMKRGAAVAAGNGKGGPKCKSAGAKANAAAAVGPAKAGKEQRLRGRGDAAGKGQARRVAGAADEDSDEDEEIRAWKDPKQRLAASRKKQAANKAAMEVVPQRAHDSDGDSTDTEDEFEAMDDNAKAEVRAMARRWMKSRKNQLNILDAAYNRYTFNDDALPKWFREDEAKHMRPMTTATREEIEAEKELLRAIDARPLKKVAEAKARKRRKVMQKTEQARNKAEAIVDNEDMSIHSKAREIGKLYAKAKAAGKDKRAMRRASSSMSRSAKEKAKRKGPPLDRRMIADKMKGRAKAITKGKRGKPRR